MLTCNLYKLGVNQNAWWIYEDPDSGILKSYMDLDILKSYMNPNNYSEYIFTSKDERKKKRNENHKNYPFWLMFFVETEMVFCMQGVVAGGGKPAVEAGAVNLIPTVRSKQIPPGRNLLDVFDIQFPALWSSRMDACSQYEVVSLFFFFSFLFHLFFSCYLLTILCISCRSFRRQQDFVVVTGLG